MKPQVWMLVVVIGISAMLPGCALLVKEETSKIDVYEGLEPCTEAESHLRQGLTYAKVQDFKNSELEFLKAIDLCPNYIEAHANLGVLYIQMNALNKAESSLKRAIDLDSHDEFALYNLTALYSLTNKLDLALDTLDDALNSGFNNIDALRNDPDLKNLRREPGFTEILEKNHIFLK